MKKHIVQQADEAEDGRRTAPAALRNTEPLINALRARLPKHGDVLELASGTGQHAAAFAEAFPNLRWTPSDTDQGQRGSIAAWRRKSGLANFAEPLALDIAQPWPVAAGSAQAIVTVNLFHLIPAAALSLIFKQARYALSASGRIIIYGPFLRESGYASDGDREFDASLRNRDPAIGYKSVQAVSQAAGANGFQTTATDEMPANNLLLTFTVSEA